MIQSNDDDDEVLRIAESMGLPYKVYISPELAEQLKPNEFISGLGIQYMDRITTVIGILKGQMLLQKTGYEETIPKNRQIIPLNLVKGPFIKEELITIKAEMSDEGRILLTAVLEDE